MSAEFNAEQELDRVNNEIATTEEKLATLTKIKLDLIPNQRLTKGMDAMTEKSLCEKALAIIDKRAADPSFDLAALAGQVGIGAVLLSYILNRSYKRSFPKLLTDARMDIAKALLGRQGFSVKQVAAKSGFSDSHYFSRVFTSYVGVSPSNYARMQQQADQATVIRNQPDPKE